MSIIFSNQLFCLFLLWWNESAVICMLCRFLLLISTLIHSRFWNFLKSVNKWWQLWSCSDEKRCFVAIYGCRLYFREFLDRRRLKQNNDDLPVAFVVDFVICLLGDCCDCQMDLNKKREAELQKLRRDLEDAHIQNEARLLPAFGSCCRWTWTRSARLSCRSCDVTWKMLRYRARRRSPVYARNSRTPSTNSQSRSTSYRRPNRSTSRSSNSIFSTE